MIFRVRDWLRESFCSEVYHVVEIQSLDMQNSMACPDTEMTRSVPSGNLNDVLDDLQGSVYFRKKLSSTNALRRSSVGRRYGQLSMPRRFVCEHSNKFRRAVELRSDLSCNKPWPHRLSFCTSREVPEVTFAGKQWGAFVTSHDLVQGDQLVFSLTAMSQFQVYVFDGLGDPKGPQKIHAPMKWSEAIKWPHKHLACRKSGNKMIRPKMCTRNKVPFEDDEIADCASNDTGCQKLSFENTPLQLQDLVSKRASCLPSFSKRLVAINVYHVEIPRDFVAAHRGQLHDSVQLQGIHEESPAQNQVRCVCYKANGRDRLFLKGEGWADFVRENQLCFGQELVFTLTADSCFTVRKEISWSPRTGLNLGSRTPMSVRKLKVGAGCLSTSAGCAGSKQ